MIVMLNVILVGYCSLSDSVNVSHQIPQRLIYIAKMTTFSIFNEKYTRGDFSFAVLFPSVKPPEENK